MRRTLTLLALAGFGFLAAPASLHSPGTAVAAPPAPKPPCLDEDNDGFGVGCQLGADCNDHDPHVHPGATETCNGKDDDCNALADDSAACVAPKLDPARVKVPAGSFVMGSTSGAKDEAPTHAVSGAAFEMDRYEVTNGRYRACEAAGKCSAPSLQSSKLRAHYHDDAKFADYPVIFVSWQQADSYCKFAGGRLPTEAEWERAAKGLSSENDVPRTFPWGNSAPDCTKANYSGCVGDTDRVGMREAGASPFGAMDMAGNVWEWTADWYDSAYYARSPKSDPKGPESGALKVMRGGCWVSGESSLRTTCRKAELPQSWAPNVGFRCVYGGAS